jgi:hypothetical protein
MVSSLEKSNGECSFIDFQLMSLMFSIDNITFDIINDYGKFSRFIDDPIVKYALMVIYENKNTNDIVSFVTGYNHPIKVSVMTNIDPSIIKNKIKEIIDLCYSMTPVYGHCNFDQRFLEFIHNMKYLIELNSIMK